MHKKILETRKIIAILLIYYTGTIYILLKIDNKNFKFVLDWDESVWTEQDKNSLPVLKRTGKARGAIVLMAEEFDPDSTEASGDADSRKFFCLLKPDYVCPETFIKRIKKEII